MTASRNHLTCLHAQLSGAGITTREAKLAYMANVLGHPVASSKDLTTAEVNRIVTQLASEQTEVLT